MLTILQQKLSRNWLFQFFANEESLEMTTMIPKWNYIQEIKRI